jgi:hypothetical protein
MSKRDCYEVLGVSRTASAPALALAFRQLVSQFPADPNRRDAAAEERLREISEAYEILKDPQRRATYDRLGFAGLASTATGANDQLYHVFGAMFGGDATASTERQQSGASQGNIFISYRRGDSAGYAGRVLDRLENEFGRDVVFMDVDDIPLGVDFAKFLQDAIAQCDVLLAVIGPDWLDARDEQGRRRLDNPGDFVRIEIATALSRGVVVIPILLQGAPVPRADQLPADLQALAVRNGLEIRHASFHADVGKLITFLKTRRTR